MRRPDSIELLAGYWVSVTGAVTNRSAWRREIVPRAWASLRHQRRCLCATAHREERWDSPQPAVRLRWGPG